MRQIKPGHRQWWCFSRHTLIRVSCLISICLFVLMNSLFFTTSPVQALLSVLPTSLPTGQVGTAYYATLMATDGTPLYTWSIPSGTLPPGLTLAPATGVISGIPTTQGTFSFVIKVTDSTAASSQQSIFITVTPRPLIFLTTSLPQPKENTSYFATLSASGGTPPYTWYVIDGTLPSGLTLEATTGTISGTPARGTVGTSSFIVTVTDSSSPPISIQREFTITVEKGSYEPIITIGSGLKAGQTKVFVGGQQVAMLHGGESMKLSFDLGTSQTISVEPVVQHLSEEGVRFKTEVDKITVNEFSLDADFSYYTEYYVELKTEPSKIGQITGSSWYKEGYTLRSTAPDTIEVEDKPSTQYLFTYWKLPTGERVSDRNLNLIVNAPGICAATYDTYYRLTWTSPYGEQNGSAWYKAGSQAQWNLTTTQVSMSGILGIFGGKLNAVNTSGTIVMDAPKNITINWEPDYTMPLILMPLALLLIILVIYGLYILFRDPRAGPALVPPPFHPMPSGLFQAMPPPIQPTWLQAFQPMCPTSHVPIPPSQPPIVMIVGEKPTQTTQTTKEQVMEKFGELFDKYEQEIKASIQTPRLPKIKIVDEDKRLPPHQSTHPVLVEAKTILEEKNAICSGTSKKLLRVVATNWRQAETRGAARSPAGEKAAEGNLPSIVWTRDIYLEWEILTCQTPRWHNELHERSTKTVYSLLNEITEEKTYEPGQEVKPPELHYTNAMPRVEIAANDVVPPDKLPPDTVS